MKNIKFILLIPSILFSMMLFSSDEQSYSIETQRCVLRPLQACDAEAIYNLSSNDQVTRYTRIFKAKKNIEEIKQYIASTINPLQWVVIEKETNQMIGLTYLWGFDSIDRKAEVGQFFFPEVWNKGFGTEVRKAIIKFGFETLGLIRLQATCDPHNLTNNKLLVKCGFKLEGYLRNYLIMSGVPCDRNFYSITKQDYENSLKGN